MARCGRRYYVHGCSELAQKSADMINESCKPKWQQWIKLARCMQIDAMHIPAEVKAVFFDTLANKFGSDAVKPAMAISYPLFFSAIVRLAALCYTARDPEESIRDMVERFLESEVLMGYGNLRREESEASGGKARSTPSDQGWSGKMSAMIESPIGINESSPR